MEVYEPFDSAALAASTIWMVPSMLVARILEPIIGILVGRSRMNDVARFKFGKQPVDERAVGYRAFHERELRMGIRQRTPVTRGKIVQHLDIMSLFQIAFGQV